MSKESLGGDSHPLCPEGERSKKIGRFPDSGFISDKRLPILPTVAYCCRLAHHSGGTVLDFHQLPSCAVTYFSNLSRSIHYTHNRSTNLSAFDYHVDNDETLDNIQRR